MVKCQLKVIPWHCTTTPQSMSSTCIKILHLTVSEIEPREDCQTHGHYDKVKGQIKVTPRCCTPTLPTNVPTTSQFPIIYGFRDKAWTTLPASHPASKYPKLFGTLFFWCFQIFSDHSKSLYWLPVKQQIIFKTLVLIHKYLNTGKPKYFALYLSLYTSAVKTRCSNPEKMFLKVTFYSSSVHNSRVHFNMCFSYDAKNTRMIYHWKFELLLQYHVSKGDIILICFRSLSFPTFSYY